MARRFFIPPGSVVDDAVTVDGDLFRHMARVLRLRTGTPVVLVDGTGWEFSGIIREVGHEHLVVAVTETRTVPPAGVSPRISLYQGLPKGDKMELIIQKAVELGVAEVIPFVAARSVVRLRGKEEEKTARWLRIAREAARQSGQSSVPAVGFAADLAAVTERARDEVKLVLWEKEKENRLRETLAELPRPETIAILVGPEGGLTDAEAAEAEESGFIPLSLGRRIVRTETASLALLAILQFYWGDMG